LLRTHRRRFADQQQAPTNGRDPQYSSVSASRCEDLEFIPVVFPRRRESIRVSNMDSRLRGSDK